MVFSQETVADSLSSKNPAGDSLKVTVPVKKADTLDASVRYLSADSMILNFKEKKAYLYHQAEVYYKEITLDAGYIEMNFGEDEVYASGQKDSTGKMIDFPKFKDGDEEFESDWMRYNFKSKKGIISNVTTEQSGGFLHGEKIKRMSDGNICMKNGYYTTCDHEHPHFYINLTKAKVIPDDKIVSGPAYLVIEDLPLPIGIPFGFFPNKKGNTSGILIPEYGEEENRGFFLRKGGYYFAINDYINTTLTGDIYSRGSWGLANTTTYRKRYKFTGKFDFSYSKVLIGEPEMTTYRNENTYWFQWHHNQDAKAHPSRQFNANVNLGSTSYNKYNSYSNENRLRSNVQSNVSFSQRWQGTPFSLSGNLRHEQNFADSTVNLAFPELNFNVSRRYPFKSKKYPTSSNPIRKIGISMTTNFKNSITTKEEDLFTDQTLRNFRNGIQHSIPVSTSMTLLKYLTVNPSLSFTSRWYFRSLDRKYIAPQYTATDTLNAFVETDTLSGFSHGTDWIINVPVTTKLYGFYMMSRPDAVIKAVRHTMTPSVSFSYRPDFSQEKWGYYQSVQTDTLGKLQSYSRFDGSPSGAWTGIYGSPARGKYGAINFNLGNNLEMKARNRKDTVNMTRKIPLLESFGISSSYNLAADSLKWAPLSINARTSILQIITVNFSNAYSFYALDSAGHAIEKYYHESSKRWARYTGASLSLGLSLNSETFNKEGKKKEEKVISEAMKQAALAAGFPEDYMLGYADFSVPWNLMVDFRISETASKYVPERGDYDFKISQTINFSGDMKLTENWKVSLTSGYDVETKSITYTSINVYRDLHCWEMRLSWIPIGFYKSYNFSLNVKASVLQDLKFNRRRSWADNL